MTSPLNVILPPDAFGVSMISPVPPPPDDRVRHDRRMPPELHLHPDRMVAHGRAACGLSEELYAALRSAPVECGPFPDEQERLLGVVGAAMRDLAELSAALGRAAAAATAAEAEIGARFREALGGERA
jgi:hypothetical protein